MLGKGSGRRRLTLTGGAKSGENTSKFGEGFGGEGRRGRSRVEGAHKLLLVIFANDGAHGVPCRKRRDEYDGHENGRHIAPQELDRVGIDNV